MGGGRCQVTRLWRSWPGSVPRWCRVTNRADGRNDPGKHSGAPGSPAAGSNKPVRVDPDPVAVEVERELSAPLAWFPRLRDATPAQRRNWEPIGRGHGLHWPDVDEDISVRALMGRPT